MNLTISGRIEDVARDVCTKELQHFPECLEQNHPGHTINCMAQHINDLEVSDM